MCVLAVYNKAQPQRISNCEFKLWMFLQGTESRGFRRDRCNISPVPKLPSKKEKQIETKNRIEHPSQIMTNVKINYVSTDLYSIIVNNTIQQH